jgi:lipoate-protein ligase A
VEPVAIFIIFCLMNPKLRVIFDGARGAAFNMAADLGLLERCADPATVFLRLYEWEVPTISIGYMQKAGQVLDLRACRDAGYQWIRRPTGGRAVLHKGDLTYCCTFSMGISAMGHTIQESYTLLSECLMRGLCGLGVLCRPHDSAIDAASVRRETKLPCFLAPNRREIMAHGRKLVGSAQKRTAHAVLQHGSIPISPAFRQLPDFENIGRQERIAHKRLLESKCACIEELSQSCAHESVARAVSTGFAQVLGLNAIEEPWSSEELRVIESRAASTAFVKQWMQ